MCMSEGRVAGRRNGNFRSSKVRFCMACLGNDKETVFGRKCTRGKGQRRELSMDLEFGPVPFIDNGRKPGFCAQWNGQL